MISTTKVVEKLTKEQEALIPRVRDEYLWLALRSGIKVEEKDIREGIEWFYENIVWNGQQQQQQQQKNNSNSNNNNNKSPITKNMSLEERKKNIKIFIFDSYVGMQLGYNLLKQMSVLKIDGKDIGGEDYDNGSNNNNNTNSNKNVREIIDKLVNRMWKNIWFDQVGNKVRHTVKNNVTQEVEATVFKTIGRGAYQSCGQQGWDAIRMITEQSAKEYSWYGMFGGMGKTLTEMAETLNMKTSSEKANNNNNNNNSATTIWRFVFDTLGHTLSETIHNTTRGSINSAVATGITNYNNNNNNNNNNNSNNTKTKKEKREDIKLETQDHFIGLGNWAGWLAFFDYFIRIGVLPTRNKQEVAAIENFIKFKDLLRKGIWTMALFDDVCLVCRLPLRAIRDDVTGRLHNTDGPAVLWRDGSAQYFLRGVNFSMKMEDHMGKPPELWEKIVHDRITFPEILKIDNMEQRRVALLEYGGSTRMLEETNAQLIDRSKRGNELYQIDSKVFAKLAGSGNNGDRARITTHPFMKYLKYRDPSTRREYVKPVHPDCKTADEGQAWSFSISETEYAELEVET